VERRYLVIFKDTALHSLRHLRAGHLDLLDCIERAVRAFLLVEHPQRHKEFQCYFHYMPSVFQLHMHVCIAKATDAGRVHGLGLVRRNLNVKSSWYRDALMLCPALRAQRQGIAPASPGPVLRVQRQSIATATPGVMQRTQRQSVATATPSAAPGQRNNSATSAPAARPQRSHASFGGIASFRGSTNKTGPIFNTAHICTCPTTRRT
jgi:hypothetical protein